MAGSRKRSLRIGERRERDVEEDGVRGQNYSSERQKIKEKMVKVFFFPLKDKEWCNAALAG